MATISNTTARSPQALEEQGSTTDRRPVNGRTPSILVRDERRRISAKHGLTHHERDALVESLDFMRRYGPGVFVTVQAGYEPAAERDVRLVTTRLRSDIATRQRRAGMKRVLTTTVFEALDRNKEPKFNGHIVAAMPNATARNELVESLNSSTAYDRLIGRAVDGKIAYAEPVTDWRKLPGYLLKEATPQAAYKKDIRRVGGSIPLGVRGGDRVILSGDLRDTLVNAGRIEPYRRTYAKRPAGAPELLAEIEVRYRDSLFDADELPQTPTLAKPKASPRRREKIEPPSLKMDYAPTVTDMLANLGPTHEAVGERVGLSRPQVTNVICGRFGLSRAVIRRVIELAKAA